MAALLGALIPAHAASAPPSPATPPYIVSTSPADGETNVSLTAPIVIVFSDPMLTNLTYIIINPAISLIPTWSNNNTVLTFTHASPFAGCTVYTIQVYGVDWYGNPLIPGPVPNPFSFTTTCTFPFIVYTYPVDGMTGVPLDASIVVVFSEPMDSASVTWTITPVIVLIPTWTSSSNLTLSHVTPFLVCSNYTMSVDGMDQQGNPLVPGPVPNPWSWSTCTTAPPSIMSTTPVNGATSVDVNSSIVVVFSEAIDRASMQYTFSWSGPPPIPFNHTWSSGDTVLTFAHVDSLPVCTVITAQIDANDTDGNPLVPGPVPNPWAWTTTCGPPVILSTDPSDGLTDVPRPKPVTVTFSEAMNPSTVTAAFNPPAANVGLVWTGPSVLTITHDPLARCTAYSVRIDGQDLQGLPLAPGPAQNPWSFSTDCGIATVTVLAPFGGESWTGGSSHAVRFLLANGESVPHTFAVDVAYAYAGGTLGGPVGSQVVSLPAGGSQTVSMSWIVPGIDVVDAVANVTARDGPLTIWDESGPFEIDSTRPAVVSATPVGPRIPLDPRIIVTFSEPLAVPPAAPLSVSPSVAVTYLWTPARDAIFASLGGTQPCTTYVVTLAPLRDDSDPGNALPPYAWSFTTVCLPTVALLTPNGGQDWTGGTVHPISWDLADLDSPALRVDLAYSIDGGVFYAPIVTGLIVGVGPGSYSWAVPKVDSTQVRVQITATDFEGNAATDGSDANLAIDSTPPALLTGYPSSGASGFKTTRDIWFVWTERTDRASFLAAFSISPNPGGLAFTWSVSNLGGDVLVVSHAPLKSNTQYTIAFETTAKDGSDPGNPLASRVVVRFNTQPPPNVNPPVAKAVGKNQVLVDEVVTLDGRQSTGTITSYVWRIVDNQGRLVGVLIGSVAEFAFRSHGRYSITLIVTDANGSTDEDTLEIAVTSNSNAGLIIGGALFASAVALAATEAGRTGLFSLFIFPLYVRRKKNEVLEHETRGMIVGYILVHPGDSYTDIRRNLMLSSGTLSYHLTVLEREGLIRAKFSGTRKLFFPRTVRVPEDGGGLHEVQLRMFRAIREVPGLAVRDLAGILGITNQHALYHLRSLAKHGYVRLERRSFALRAYPIDGASPPLSGESGENR